MTTIAYRGGVLASESRITEKSFIWTDNAKKIWRLDDGSLFAAAGDDDGGHKLLEAVRHGNRIEFLDDTRGVRVYRDGRITVFEGSSWSPWNEPYVAIGSGKKYAMAAMMAGASAVKAVEIAVRCDVYSGGAVQWLSLDGGITG